ncbi:MAG: aspartate carbamoyltransferase [Oscillospiraceae bacterium]|nr:aspartate carbamoyltransferase [Oscillospiraceae bacterium]MBQ9982770.1 aspartate carbamoyltransferase [Oscillospiraceae bacterium]
MTSEYQHLIDLNDYPVSWWNKLITLGKDIYRYPERYKGACSGKVMATLFYEPSTRTQMSFQTAMLRLGGSLIGFDNPSTSSVSKGENLKDTTKVVSSYADIMVIRHPVEGAAKAAAISAECPVINAGDGGHLHPTQTLTDMLTLTLEKGTLEGLTIGLCGDLMNGRTVHSLCKALSCYKNNKFVLISTKELTLPSYIKDILNVHNCEYTENSSLEDAISELDVLYMTRIQRERFASEEEYLAQKNVYVLDKQKMKNARKDLIVMHPLPRVDEIEIDVDDDERALYFKQAKYGVYIRMALILKMLENKNPSPVLKGTTLKDICCHNPKCISNRELYLPKSFVKSGDIAECEYCDERILLK